MQSQRLATVNSKAAQTTIRLCQKKLLSTNFLGRMWSALVIQVMDKYYRHHDSTGSLDFHA